MIANDLAERRVLIRFLNERIDTTTPQGRIMFHVFAMIAQFERDLIADRTRIGLEVARATGRIKGRWRLLAHAQIAQAQTWLLKVHLCRMGART